MEIRTILAQSGIEPYIFNRYHMGAGAALDITRVGTLESIDLNSVIFVYKKIAFPQVYKAGLLITTPEIFDYNDEGMAFWPTTITVERPRYWIAKIARLLPTPEFQLVKGVDVRVGPRTIIGHEGFGWEVGLLPEDPAWVEMPSYGGIRIGDRVTIGSLCTVARGTFGDTTIGDDTHIDDGVHIAHNCRVGNRVIIAAHAMLAGSVKVEDDVWIGPGASIMQGVKIGKGATIGVGSVVLRNVGEGETVVGHHRVIPTKEQQEGVTR